jgi:hypothetical protein
MKAGQRQKIAAFRKRLAVRQASWAIEIPARSRITLELTEEQRQILLRATKHVVPSVTLVFSSDVLEPTGHALACLELRRSTTRRSTTRAKPRSRTPGRRPAR